MLAADVGGVFRVPGSVRVVNALYTYYCGTDKDSAHVSRTFRSGNLPTHITYTVQDVASTFKKFLSTLPGGILGSLGVFDTFVAIHSQVRSDPKYRHSTKARLIALAVGTVQSHLRRELICAVFGLLSFLGSAGENAPDTNGEGNAASASTLMSYEALGIVFGPLLVGDLLSSQTTKLADPSEGVVLLPATPPMSKREKQRRIIDAQMQVQALAVDKVWVANQIAIMMLQHWSEAVEYMRGYGVLRPNRKTPALGELPPPPRGDVFRATSSEPLISRDEMSHFISRKPPPRTAPSPHSMPEREC